MILRLKVGMSKAFLLILCAVGSTAAFHYVDFDLSMRTEKYMPILEHYNNRTIIRFFKALYEKNKATEHAIERQDRIPHIIHHVWLGNPLCQKFRTLRQTWIDAHPNWTFIFWTDRANNDEDACVVQNFQELDALIAAGTARRIVVITDQLMFDNRHHFDAARNYGERSDILKWEIVYRYGGLYADTDFQCYKPLDDLHRMFDFYTGLQPLDTGRVQLGAALFAAYPHHPILECCVKDLRPGPGPIVIRTGPIHFTSACLRSVLDDSNSNIVLPSSYFYPCGYDEQELPESEWRMPESYAVHHWSGSWLKPEAFANR